MKFRYLSIILFCLIIICFSGVPLFSSYASGNYQQVTGPCNFIFPSDHADHPDYRTEWWYYTGNLITQDNRPFGFQITFFRSRIAPPKNRAKWPNPSSAWRADEIFMAHAAISDIRGQKFYHSEKLARRTMNIAGTHFYNQLFTLFLGNWYAKLDQNVHSLFALTEDFTIKLDLLPKKAPVSHGDAGYSRKGSNPNQAGCYYSFSRLSASGRLSIDQYHLPVSGTAWMDHEYSSAPLSEEIEGWDWFSVQLKDQTEIMLYFLRLKTGGYHEASGGTFIDSNGNSNRLSLSDLNIKALKTWHSPHTNADYPISWRINILSLGLDISVEANIPDQELSNSAVGISYWEGSVGIIGTKNDKRIQGNGYLEMTGYDKAYSDTIDDQ